jgi:hypothetical protein
MNMTNNHKKIIPVAAVILLFLAAVFYIGLRENGGRSGRSIISHPAVKQEIDSKENGARFDDFMQQVFRLMVSEDTLTLNYTLISRDHRFLHTGFILLLIFFPLGCRQAFYRCNSLLK